MTHLIIHIGWPKTGTTALQDFCTLHGALLARHGLAYYASRAGSCGSVVRALAKGEALEDPGARFRDWADRQSAARILISAEGFAGCDPKALDAFLMPDRWDSATVIGYLRPQEEFIEGWYKQLVKWGGKAPLAHYLQPGTPIWAAADYRTELQRWHDWCVAGGHRLDLRIFQKAVLSGGNFGTDFFTTLGLPDLTARIEAKNVSPSAALIGLYLKLPQIDKLQQINRAMVASGHPAATGSGDLLPPEAITDIRNRYANANEDIRAAHFPARTSLFDPPAKTAMRPDATGLDDLLIETIAKMRGPDIAHVAQQALRRR